MKKGIIAAIIAAAIGIPVIAYAAGPLFINTTIDEPLPRPVTGEEDMMDKGGDEMMDGEDSVQDKPDLVLAGTFVGAGDGIHDATGTVKIVSVGESKVLRLEDFRSTNGPDLYVYVSSDKEAGDFVSLGRLKANIGNQNYEIPDDTDLSKYDTVLIWCKQFSVLFGSAALEA